jgi:hypothetical protein
MISRLTACAVTFAAAATALVACAMGRVATF